ncbi:solute carrier family 22 member 21 [Elysia marginata]|uniref:Solute carrier family 22 member 21 n=1 Tax=Elysia marginata TaxID=1093978 RepID=A0AAV4EXU2_9GAST|nr:solute carrier family 22 member 21 [Elysia marginata]
MAIEDIYDDIGGLGTFQAIILIWLYGMKSIVGWSMMQMAFAGYGPGFTCNVDGTTDGNHYTVAASDSATLAAANGLNGSSLGATASSLVSVIIENGTTRRDVCSVNGSSCSSYTYDGVKRTIVTEFDLVCDQKWIRSTITSVQMGGVMLGAFIAGQAGDYIGRKRTNYGFYLLGAVFNIVAMFSTSWQMFIILRFIIGISIGAMLVIVIPYPAEFFPQRWRYLVTVIPTWPVGVLLFAFFAWLLEDWSHLHLACAIFQLPGLLGYFYVPESVRWLTVQGRTEEAYAVIKKMAHANRKPVPEYAKGMLERIAELERQTQGKSKKYSYLDIFKSRAMLRLTLIFAFHWCSLSIVFYGLSFAVSGLSGDLYMNMLLMTSVELPAYLFNLCLTQRLGRRWTCFAFYAVAAIASGGCVVVHLLGERGGQT